MIITRYLSKEIFNSLVANTIILLLIFASNQFVHYMHIAALGKISSHAIMILMLLELPLLLSMLLPLSYFLAVLLTYGKLYADSEITVLSACGYSPFSLLKTTIGFSCIIMLVVATLSLWLGPMISNYIDQILAGSTSSKLELLFPNRFQEVNNGKWVFYVDKTSQDKTKLQKIFAAEQPNVTSTGGKNEHWGILVANSGEERKDPTTGDSFLVLHNGYRHSGFPGQNDYQIIKYDEYGIRMEKNYANQPKQEDNISTLSLWEKRHDKALATELHWRIALPISVLILALLGTPLSKVKTRRGRYAQLLPAALFYIIYVQLLFLCRAWLKKGSVSIFLGMWWVHAIMLLIAAGLIIQQLGWRNVWQKVISSANKKIR